MHYFTKIVGRPISEAEAYQRASPVQRATWWPQGAPVKADTAGPAGADLDAAVAAGQRAQQEGYGSRRCGTCAGCTYRGTCRRPPSLAMARLKAAQAAADRLDQAEADALACQRAAFAWERAHGRLL